MQIRFPTCCRTGFAVIILLIFFISNISFPQVTIKERVEIKPELYFNLNSGPPSNTITLNIQWDNLKVSVWVIGSVIPCQDVTSTPSENDGELSFIIENAQPGTYWFLVFAGGVEYEDVNLTCQILLNDVQVKTETRSLTTSFNYTTGDWSRFWIDYTPGLISDYFLSCSENLCYEQERGVGISTSKSCTGVAWNPSIPISLSIVQGSEYVSFYHRIEGYCFDTFEPRGDNITVSKSELDNYIVIKQDEMFEGAESKAVKIQADWGGVIRTDSAIIYPKNRYFINAKFEEGKDSLLHGDQVKMTLTGTANVNSWYCTPLELTYNAEILKGGEYGNLLNNRTGEKGQILTELWQYTLAPCQPCGNADLGYIADGVEPEKTDSIVIRFSTSDPKIPPSDTVLIIKPPPLKVTIIPETIAAGDTAKIIIQKRNLDGSVEDFPPEQTFEIGMVDGCALGNILGCLDGDCWTETYSYGVPQEVQLYFAADSSSDSGGVVKIRVGLIEEDNGGGTAGKIIAGELSNNLRKNKKVADIKRESDKVKNKKIDFNKHLENKVNNSTISDTAIENNLKNMDKIEGVSDAEVYCWPGSIESEAYCDAKIVIGDECDEKVVECSNYATPVFENVVTTMVLSENKPWQWEDNLGELQTTNTGSACNFQADSMQFGKTYIMPRIGDFATNTSVYNLLDDMVVTVCKDKSNPTDPIWRYSVDNVRVPIFKDHCPFYPNAQNLVDLGDGTNANLLADNIKNCSDYNSVMDAFFWWKIGPYRMQWVKIPHFYFSAGILEHEKIHVQQIRDGGTKIFPTATLRSELINGRYGFPSLKLFTYSAIIAKCPEDALNAPSRFGNMKNWVREQIKTAILTSSNLHTLGGTYGGQKFKCEYEADELARLKYDEIKKNIQNWAKQQSWWCNPKTNNDGTTSFVDCDNSDCQP